MAGDAALVEDEKRFGSSDARVEEVAELVERDVGEVPFGVGEELDVLDPEDVGLRGDLFRSDLAERPAVVAEGRCLPVGEAQHADATAAGDEGDDRAEAEGLVVGVGADDEHLAK